MSHAYYMNLFKKTDKQLGPTLEYDISLQKAKKKIKDPRVAYSTVFTLYLEYISLIKNLDQCYDQIVQPQKRPLLRKLLDMCIGRMLELKNELIDLDVCEYNYNDNALIEQKMTPWDMEIVVPRYFVHEREAEIAQRKKFMSELFEKMNTPSPEKEDLSEGEEGLEELTENEREGKKSETEQGKTEEAPQKEDSKAEANAGGPSESQPEEPTDEIPPDEVEVSEEVEETETVDEEEAELERIRKTLPPPVIDLTPQQRREIRKARENEREAERSRIVKKNEEEWLKLAREAVFVIQTAERARQGRYKFVVAETIFAMRQEVERKQRGERTEVKVTEEQKISAASTIQRAWKNHVDKRKLRRRELDLMLMMGICLPSWRPTVQQDRVEHVRRLRYDEQEDNLIDYLEDQRLTLKNYQIRKGPWLFEDYTDEIREWFIEWYTKAKCFPEFPNEEDGGSLLMVQGLVKTPEQYMKEQEEERIKKERAKKVGKTGAKTKTKEQIKKEKKEAKEREEKKKREEERKRLQDERDNPGYKMKESLFFYPMLVKGDQDYKSVWEGRNERMNPLQKHYMDIVEAEKLNEVELSVRKAVDVMMRLELERLNEALRKDIAKRKKGKKGQGGDGKKKKKNKDKKGKGKKKKKDPTGDKTAEELFTELYMNKIIRPYPEEKLSAFFGQHNYIAFDMLRRDMRPLHSLGDVRNLVNQYCILPIGSPAVHQLAPLIKSVCLIGPPGCGKHFLANAICSELGATMFDLSPENIAGKYDGKAGNQMLIHLVSKMAKLLQPSIIYVDGAEKPFYKKVPKQERQIEPKKLAKILPKVVKAITKEDQVLVLGISQQPWAARPRPLAKAYNKFVLVPRPDYRNTYFYWLETLMKYHSVNRNFDVSSLAKLTQGYSIATINEVVKKIMSDRRILDQVNKPLTPQELFEGMLHVNPITENEEAKYITWFNKWTPLGRKLTKFLTEQAIMKAREEKIKKK